MSAVAELNARLDEALAVDARALTPDQQADDLAELTVAANKIQALLAVRAKAARDTDATVEVYGRKAKATLVEEHHLDGAEAGRVLRLGHTMADAPLVATAITAGDITRDHALLIGKALAPVKDCGLRETVEHELVRLALDWPPEVLRRAVSEILDKYVDDDAARDAHDRRYAERGVTARETIGGAGSLQGTLTAETQEKLRVYFEAKSGATGPEDDRTQAQRRHDALDELLDFGLAHMDGLSPVDAERPRVTVHIDYRSLLGLVSDHTAIATLGSGVAISPDTARRLACDAQILPVVLGGPGEVLDVAQPRSMFSAAVRRAAWIRDGAACSFPRCRQAPRHLHHITFRRHGGAGTLDNSAWLCPFHHWLVHEGGWSLRRGIHGRCTWTSPDGREVTGDPPPRRPEAA